jgi:hypothetical protein
VIATLPRVIIVPAVVALLLLAGLAALQLALLAGAPLGRLAWGGQHRVLPRRLRVGSAVSVVLYGLFALVLAAAARRTSGPAEIGSWVLAAYFGVGALLNLASRSRPERLVMTPVALVLALCSLALAVQA